MWHVLLLLLFVFVKYSFDSKDALPPFCFFLMVWVQVGAYFFREYYRVLVYDPRNIHHFYSDNSTMTRVDGIYSETASDKLVLPNYSQETVFSLHTCLTFCVCISFWSCSQETVFSLHSCLTFCVCVSFWSCLIHILDGFLFFIFFFFFFCFYAFFLMVWRRFLDPKKSETKKKLFHILSLCKS